MNCIERVVNRTIYSPSPHSPLKGDDVRKYISIVDFAPPFFLYSWCVICDDAETYSHIKPAAQLQQRHPHQEAAFERIPRVCIVVVLHLFEDPSPDVVTTIVVVFVAPLGISPKIYQQIRYLWNRSFLML